MYSYSKSFIEKIAAETGFIRDNLEKVFRLFDILQFLNSNANTSDHLLLKGGTAINLTVFNMPRLSVDIDLDFCKECSREEMMDLRAVINEDILMFMFSQGYALSPNTKNPHSLDSWVFYFQNAGGNKDNLKIEINYSMRNHVLPIIKQNVEVNFLPKTKELATLSIIELFGSKIKALIERTAARDLYDVNNMIIYNVIKPEQQDLLRKTVLFYLVVGSAKKMTIPFNFDGIDNLKYNKIRATLIPVLKKSEHFEFEAAKSTVKEYLSSLMTLTESEELFVESFYNGVYQPDLLFDNDDIINRIKEHPMAIWKVKSITNKLTK